LLDLMAPQTLNGYRYGNNNPATYSDPDGLREFIPKDPVTLPSDPEVQKIFDSIPTEEEVAEAGRKQAIEKISQHAKVVHEKKERVKKVVKDLVKIVADELGITDALNCFTDGDVGACVATGVTVLSSFVGGIAGKLLSKYLFKAKKAWKLIGRIKDLAGEAIDGIKGVRKAEKDLADAVGRCNSFAPGTKVLMEDGSSKPIEEITVGDKVKAGDPQSGKVDAQRVVGTIVGQGQKQLVELTISVADSSRKTRTTKLVATDGHAFYRPLGHQWVAAVDLQAGDVLQSSLPGTTVTVTQVRSFTRIARVYNLTIAELHTYYVVGAQAPVLVHNDQACEFDDAVEVGLDHMEARVEQGADNHIIAGCQTRCDTGNYLSEFQSRARDYVDTDTGAEILIDRTTRDSQSRPVVLIRKQWSIHGYHMAENSITAKLRSGSWG
jgi:hypothetical protein